MDDGFEDLKEDFVSFRKLGMVFVTLLLISYILYHLYNGNYGFKNYINKQSIINKRNIDTKNLEKEISSIKNKINRLQDDNLDSDLIDEEIRKNTGYVKENEIVIYSNEFMNNE